MSLSVLPQSVSYTLKYTVLQNIDRYEEKSIPSLKPDQATLETVKEAILKKEELQGSQLTCELFTKTGVPLSNDPYLATCKFE